MLTGIVVSRPRVNHIAIVQLKVALARSEAFALVADDPHLRKPDHEPIRKEFLRQNRKDTQFFDVA